MGSAGRAGPWIRATSKGFGYVAAFSPPVQRLVRCAGAASTIRPHHSHKVLRAQGNMALAIALSKP